ncbi:MAG TPA: DNA topoisomerase IV subunit A [Burkholderiaceae bacterium]|nr:DNA topoisomerase IV subunit A [Burkholderiaceae bacterium]
MDTRTIPPEPPAGDDDTLTLARYAERAYLDYAVSVVKGRALPDVADGQKPVQRRILYAMNEMGLGPSAKPVKSARVVGDVLGRFHPHGDTAAYDALVRMAQAFTLRYPLIDGQGNFGSRDGDGAAAMRYTEARLTPYARLLLDEIGEGTVDFVPNYDGSTQEPALLPARLPMVLLNGASGIAVGMATEIPPHNLREVAQAAVVMARNPKAGLDDVLAVLPGPDFPGGGQVISSPAEIRDVYASGRGSIKVRARHTVEELARGQWQLVVTELPHGVSAAKVLEEIEELTNPKVRLGKKAVTPEQLQLKQTVLGVLDVVRDESGRDAAVRLVFEPRSSRIEPRTLVSTLLAHTSLETGVPVNLVMIGRDGRPRQKPLVEIVAEWVEFRVGTLVRRTRHRLAKVDDRIHILEGRQLVLLNIDEVIRIIREADEPKPALVAAFGLSDRQAEDILEIRLRQLARLEAIRIEKELAGLRTERGQLDALLASDSAMRRQLIREIEADAKQYGDARRTLIEEAARTVVEVRIAEEPVTVVVSEKGWVRARQGHGHDASQFAFKAGDAFYGAYEVRTTDQLYAVAPNGRVHSIPVSSLPSARGDGVPVTSFVELEPGARIEHAFAAHAEAGVLLTTRGGNGFICQAGDLASRNKAGRQFLTLDDGDSPARPATFVPGQGLVALLAGTREKARMLVFGLDELKALKNGGRGTALVDLGAGESLLQAVVCGAEGLLLTGIGNGGKIQEDRLTPARLEEYRGSRGRKGRALEPRRKEPRLSAPRAAGE